MNLNRSITAFLLRGYRRLHRDMDKFEHDLHPSQNTSLLPPALQTLANVIWLGLRLATFERGAVFPSRNRFWAKPQVPVLT